MKIYAPEIIDNFEIIDAPAYVREKYYSLGDRSNRYIDAPINWFSYPGGVVLAKKGTYQNYEQTNKDKCDSVVFTFLPLDHKIGDPQHSIYSCDKLDCFTCGIPASYRSARRIALNLLKVANCGFDVIRFFSMNIYNHITNEYAKPRITYVTKGGQEKTKVLDFEFYPNMDFPSWLEKCFKQLNEFLKNVGMIGFHILYHADRLKQVDGVEVRHFNSHFHVVGVGTLPKSNLFYQKYGFTYTSQKSVRFNSPKQMASLIPRIAYRLNHCAFYKKSSGKNSKAYRSFGVCSNNGCITVREQKLDTHITNDVGSLYVAKDARKWLKSSTSNIPKHVMNKAVILLNKARKLVAKTGFAGKYPTEFNLLTKYRHYSAPRMKEGWRNAKMDCIENQYSKKDKDKKIYLKEIEFLKEVRIRGINPFTELPYNSHIISSNDLYLHKDSNKNVLGYSKERIEAVHSRFNELKEISNQKRGVCSGSI